MLETVIIILLVLWALGFIGGFASGSLIHLLLVVALVVFVVRMFPSRRSR